MGGSSLSKINVNVSIVSLNMLRGTRLWLARSDQTPFVFILFHIRNEWWDRKWFAFNGWKLFDISLARSGPAGGRECRFPVGGWNVLGEDGSAQSAVITAPSAHETAAEWNPHAQRDTCVLCSNTGISICPVWPDFLSVEQSRRKYSLQASCLWSIEKFWMNSSAHKSNRQLRRE